MRNNRRTATSIFVVLSVRFSDLDTALLSEGKRLAELLLVYPEKRRETYFCALNMVTANNTTFHDLSGEGTHCNADHS